MNVFRTESTCSPLRNGDPVQCGIRLTIATAVESVAVVITRPHWNWCRPVPTSEGCFGPKAHDTGDLADELGGRKRTAAGQLQQRWRKRTHASGDLPLEVVGSNAQLPRMHDELACDVDDDAIQSSQTSLKLVQDAHVAKTSGSDLKARKQLVEMPAQPILDTGPLKHQVFAMVDQQSYFSRWSVKLRAW